ncbi:hypothetical protein [Luteococcus peritonei]|uniref:Uncharacterized protein n=1 Tax=Luteococcus peritonei TaxID=88874 RepID=A0ABW4RXB7_9ACTN
MAELLQAVSLALVGERIDGAAEDPQRVVESLAAAGWPAERVQQLRQTCQDEERAWPLAVERDLLAAVGFARYGAVLKEVRRLLGVDGLVPTVRRGPRLIGPAEQRLMAERPPHHGNVG